MKLLIAGSRSIEHFDLAEYVSSETDMIISGGAKGIDSLAEQYADQHRISKLILRPRYDLYGRAAPIIRNQQMVDMADEILIIWDGQSKGTRETERYAKKMQKQLTVVLCEQSGT